VHCITIKKFYIGSPQRYGQGAGLKPTLTSTILYGENNYSLPAVAGF
jgi:hypothetical protein